ncbi:MAG TPA: cytochrome C, partial [Burkholderiales bacterium]|nr:cytochrome C [Burkholderiales bacterium]
GAKGEGQGRVPAVWGLNSFNAGAGLNNVQKLAGFIWANMPMGNERSLTYQEALDVAAFINLQYRAFDPREGRLKKLAERIYHRLTLIFGKDNP